MHIKKLKKLAKIKIRLVNLASNAGFFINYPN